MVFCEGAEGLVEQNQIYGNGLQGIEIREVCVRVLADIRQVGWSVSSFSVCCCMLISNDFCAHTHTHTGINQEWIRIIVLHLPKKNSADFRSKPEA